MCVSYSLSAIGTCTSCQRSSPVWSPPSRRMTQRRGSNVGHYSPRSLFRQFHTRTSTQGCEVCAQVGEARAAQIGCMHRARTTPRISIRSVCAAADSRYRTISSPPIPDWRPAPPIAPPNLPTPHHGHPSTDQPQHPPPQFPQEVVEPGIGDIRVAASGDIGPASMGCLLQRLELGCFELFAPLDQTQAFAQHFACVLVTPGLHQAFDKILLMFTEHYIACRHGRRPPKWNNQGMPMNRSSGPQRKWYGRLPPQGRTG